MEIHDDDLSRFAAEGAAPLLATEDQGYVFASLQRPEQFNAVMLRVLETFKTSQVGC